MDYHQPTKRTQIYFLGLLVDKNDGELFNPRSIYTGHAKLFKGLLKIIASTFYTQGPHYTADQKILE